MDFDRLGFSDFQWVIHPENWFVIARIDKQQGLWRVVYGETPGLSVDEIRSRLPERFRTTLPGHPDLSQYQLASVTPYVVHQRCAEKMRVGRVLLAGDAAHLNNPM
jgi:2-polyprenyl-6-methoxyphenol hydroxylase-like FAD-dependent oxidoreductase